MVPEITENSITVILHVAVDQIC